MEPNLEPKTTEFQEHSTPTKAAVQGTIAFLENDGQTGRKRDVFRFFGVGHTQGYEMIKNNDTARRLSHSYIAEPREAPHKLTKRHIDHAEEIIQTWGLEEGRALGWTQLISAAEIPKVSWRTLQRELKARNYHKCKACLKFYSLLIIAKFDINGPKKKFSHGR